jgi:PPM family protein phosphatase
MNNKKNKLLTYRSFGSSDRGVLRPSNEDAFVVNKELSLYAVADGVGGLPNGGLASHMAIETLVHMLQDHAIHSATDWELIFNVINKHIHSRGIALNEVFGMGTTLTTTIIENNRLVFAHAGDTGLIVYRDGELQRLTHNHTLGQKMKDNAGVNDDIFIPDHFLHSLTRCLGQYGYLKVDAGEYLLKSGDRILLYSDGITNGWTDSQLAELFKVEQDPKETVYRLIQESNERSGTDNSTAIVVFVE